MQDVAAEPRAQTGNVRQLIDQTGGDQQAAGRKPGAVGEQRLEAGRGVFEAGHGAGQGGAAVAGDLAATDGEQLWRRHAVAREVAVEVCGGCVAGLVVVDDDDAALCSGQDEGGGQAGCPTADDDDVVDLLVLAHGRSMPSTEARWRSPLPDPGTRSPLLSMALSQKLESTLAQVGPRLRAVRAHRGRTLTDVAEQTGISKSTLSRLESGQRRPSLELLLPLAEAYRVPLDDLVGAPEVGDPRIRLKPHARKGRTVVPLSQRPGGVQAWKVVIPKQTAAPELKSHEGYEWMYVLSGRLRLLLDGHDVVLDVGQVAEFDTRVPHWFGSTGDGPVEVLSVFGPQGERMQQRAAPRQRTSADITAERDAAMGSQDRQHR